MKSKLLAVALLSSALAGCLGTGQSGRGPDLQGRDANDGWQLTGALFTPDTDANLRIYNAPIPCGTSFCPSGSWEPIGVLRSGAVGTSWPSGAGIFRKVIGTDEMAARRQVAVTCSPGQWWYVDFSATDTATNRTVTDYRRLTTTTGFFFGRPRCRS